MDRMGHEPTDRIVKYLCIFRALTWLTIDYDQFSRGDSSLRFFEWKVRSNISERSFDKARGLIRNEFYKDVDDVRRSRRILAEELGLYTQGYDCCINNCMAFTGMNAPRRICEHCKEPRFDGGNGGNAEEGEYITNPQAYANLNARATYHYLPIIPRLRLLYANKVYSEKMRYPRALLDTPWADGIKDVWEGARMKDLRQKGMSK